MDFSPADHKVHCGLNQISNKLFRWLCVCVCYLDVVLPVELSGFLLWQTTGAVLQWGENGGGNIDVVTLHRAQIINYHVLGGEVKPACCHMVQYPSH